MNIGIDLKPLEKPLQEFAEAKKSEIEMQKPLIEGLAKSFDHFGSAIDRLVEIGTRQEGRCLKMREARDEVEKMRLEVEKAELEAKVAVIRSSSKASLEEAAKARAEAEILEAQNELREQKLKQKKLEHQEEEEEKKHEVKMKRLAEGKVSDYDL